MKKNDIKRILIWLMILVLTSLSVSAESGIFNKNPNKFALSHKEYSASNRYASYEIYFKYSDKKLLTDMYTGNSHTDSRYNDAVVNAIDSLPKLKVSKTASKENAEFVLAAVASIFDTLKGPKVAVSYYELRPNELRYNNTSYVLTNEQYTKLRKPFKKAENVGYSYPEWMVEINLERIEYIYCKKNDSRWNISADGQMYELMALTRGVLRLRVSPGYFKDYSGTKVGIFPQAFEMRAFFDTKGYYDIIINGDKLYIERSDKDYGCEYILEAPAETLEILVETVSPPYYVQGHTVPDDTTVE